MKKNIIQFMLLSLSSMMLQAVVEPLSEPRIAATVAALEAKDAARYNIRALTLGLTAAAGGYYLYSWWNEQSQMSKMQKALNNQKKADTKLKKQLDEMKEAIAHK